MLKLRVGRPKFYKVPWRSIIMVFLFVGCAIDVDISDRTLESGSFDLSNPNNFDFNSDYVEVRDGKLQLKSLDLIDQGEDFSMGQHTGTQVVNQRVSLQDRPTNVSTHVNTILPSQAVHLLGYWRMDEDFNDSSGNGAHGVPEGDVSASGQAKLGTAAADFDGVGDAINIDNGQGLFDVSRITYGGWFKVTADGVNVQHVLMEKRHYTHVVPYYDYGLYYNRTSNNLYCYATVNGTGASASINVPLVANSEWRQIYCTYDGNTFSLYVNGERRATSSFVGSLTSSVNTNLKINGHANGAVSEEQFIGQVDDIAIWSEALSESDIKDLYEKQNPSYGELSSSWTPKFQNIVGYWKMNDNWLDSSSYAHHGNPVNTPEHSENAKVGSHSGLFDGNVVNLQHAVLPSNAILDDVQEGSYTLMAWVNPDQLPPNNDTDDLTAAILMKTGYHIGIRYVADGRFSMDYCDDGPALIYSYSSHSFPPGSYYHVVGVIDTIEKAIKIYVNGVLEGSVPFVNPSFEFGSALWRIGLAKTVSPYTWPFSGNIDEASIWNTALSANDISTIYNRQKQMYSGHFDSKILNVGSPNAGWPGIGWETPMPFGKELVVDVEGQVDSAESLDYPGLDGDIDPGLISYWSMNETLTNTQSLNRDLQDFSNNNYHMDLLGSASLGREGRFFKGVEFYGLDGDGVSVVAPKAFESNVGAISLWVNTGLDWSTDGGSTFDTAIVISNLGLSGARPGLGISIKKNGIVQVQASDSVCGSPCNQVNFDSSNAINAGEWNHILVSYDKANGSTQKLFVNGIKTEFTSLGAWDFDTNHLLTIGDNQSGIGWYEEYKGRVDEVSYWETSFSDEKALALYRRGMNRIKIQAKSCVDEACLCKSFSSLPQGSSIDCDGDGIANASDDNDIHRAHFMGPGGDSSTFFSELLNRPSDGVNFDCDANTSGSSGDICVHDEIFLGGTTRAQSPIFSFDEYLGSVKPQPNPYFQYRVLMEAEENTACGGRPCLPELTSVNLNPSSEPKFFGVTQVVTTKEPLNFKRILSADIVADDCVGFQLSPDGSQFYAWDETSRSWMLETVSGRSSDRSVLQSHITQYSSQFGQGRLFLRAFMTSQDLSACSISKIQFQTSGFLEDI